MLRQRLARDKREEARRQRERIEAIVRIYGTVKVAMARYLARQLEREEQERKAAISLQKIARSKLARKKVEGLQRAGMMIQRVYRGRVGRRLAAEERARLEQERKEDEAAILIQRRVRGYLTRRRISAARKVAEGRWTLAKRAGLEVPIYPTFDDWRLETSLGGGPQGFNVHMARHGAHAGMSLPPPMEMALSVSRGPRFSATRIGGGSSSPPGGEAAGDLFGVVIVATAEEKAKKARASTEGSRRRFQDFERERAASRASLHSSRGNSTERSKSRSKSRGGEDAEDTEDVEENGEEGEAIELCGSCGNSLMSDSFYCRKCGTKRDSSDTSKRASSETSKRASSETSKRASSETSKRDSSDTSRADESATVDPRTSSDLSGAPTSSRASSRGGSLTFQAKGRVSSTQLGSSHSIHSIESNIDAAVNSLPRDDHVLVGLTGAALEGTSPLPKITTPPSSPLRRPDDDDEYGSSIVGVVRDQDTRRLIPMPPPTSRATSAASSRVYSRLGSAASRGSSAGEVRTTELWQNQNGDVGASGTSSLMARLPYLDEIDGPLSPSQGGSSGSLNGGRPQSGRIQFQLSRDAGID